VVNPGLPKGPDAWLDPQSDAKQPERGRRVRRYVSNEIVSLGDVFLDDVLRCCRTGADLQICWRPAPIEGTLLLCAESEIQARCVSKVILAIVGRRPEVP
jgi:hypothetical protein